MQLNEYQVDAALTDQVGGADERAAIIPLLGIAGEVGSLLAEYKKSLRDGEAHVYLRENMREELGDILWYLSNLATKFGLDLEDVAEANLRKTKSRWHRDGVRGFTFYLDDGFPEHEQMPREFIAVLKTESDGKVALSINGEDVGDRLRDNAYDADGYRFHDVLHMAHLAVLGWSPNLRGLMKRKRKSMRDVDEVEDGGRAIVIDEALVALEWDYARRHLYLQGVDRVDFELLERLRSLAGHLEVRVRSMGEWEQAVLQGFRVWREVNAVGGGRIRGDLAERTLVFLGPPEPD